MLIICWHGEDIMLTVWLTNWTTGDWTTKLKPVQKKKLVTYQTFCFTVKRINIVFIEKLHLFCGTCLLICTCGAPTNSYFQWQLIILMKCPKIVRNANCSFLKPRWCLQIACFVHVSPKTSKYFSNTDKCLPFVLQKLL